MKRIPLAALLLVGLIGSASAVQAAGAYDVIWNVADQYGTPTEYDMPSPAGVRFMAFDGVNRTPTVAQLGAGLYWDGTSIVPTGLTFDAITGLSSALAGKADTSHTHTASQITDFNSAVDARLASSTQPDWTQASTTNAAFIKNKPSVSYATTTRSVNTAFQVSSTSAAFVSYTVDVATTLSLTGGETGTVTLQYADDSGFTTNVKTVQSSVNGNTGTLTIGLAMTQTSTASLTGIIPAGKYVKIVTANTAGTPTFTYRTQQEVLIPL